MYAWQVRTSIPTRICRQQFPKFPETSTHSLLRYLSVAKRPFRDTQVPQPGGARR